MQSQTNNPTLSLIISAKKVTLVLGIISVALMLAYLGSKWAIAALPDSSISHLAPFFDLDRGYSIPTSFNVLLLVGCVLLLFLIAFAQKRAQGGFRYWVALGLIFMFLALDSYYRVHVFLSALSYRMQELGWIFIPWIWVYAA